MDYSVCLGIHYCEDGCHPPPGELSVLSGLCSPLAALRGFEPKFQCTLVRDQAARHVVYSIGIVDVLQKYNWKKVVAHAAKSLSLGGSTRSTPHHHPTTHA